MTDGKGSYRQQVTSVRCACGAPERCWPDSETRASMDTGYPWCRVCRDHHREPECFIEAAVDSGEAAP